MNTINFSLRLILVLLLSVIARSQDAPPPLPSDAAEKPQESHLEPGVLPEGTSAEAKARWNDLKQATLVEGTQRQPVRSFRLMFDLRYQPVEGGSNDLHATYSFLAQKNYVRFTLTSGREGLRGPDGDFSITDDGQKVRLVGRDYDEDRRQLDEAVRIAKNFVALTDPARLRIAKLKADALAPKGLPEKLEGRASKLVWIEVVSPDFHLQRSGALKSKKERLFRVLLGLDPKTHRIDLAELREVGRVRTAPILISFEKYTPLDGFQIPRLLKFYEIAPGAKERVYRDKPTSDLVLRSDQGTLRANLKPEDFKP